MSIEPPEPTLQPGMPERAIDTATDMSRTITDVSVAPRAAVDRLSDAIETACEAGQPLSTISAITREAPLASLLSRSCSASRWHAGARARLRALSNIKTNYFVQDIAEAIGFDDANARPLGLTSTSGRVAAAGLQEAVRLEPQNRGRVAESDELISAALDAVARDYLARTMVRATSQKVRQLGLSRLISPDA